MAFWKQNDVVPKRKFRFKVTLANDVAWWAKDVKVPTFSVGETQHSYLDNVYKFPGKTTWDDVNLTLVDPAGDNDVINKTMEIITNAGYDVRPDPTNNTQAAMSTISKSQFASNQQSLGSNAFKIEILDETGAIIESWTLNNPFLKSVDFDTMSYESDDLRSISLTVAYDWATCEVAGQTYLPK